MPSLTLAERASLVSPTEYLVLKTLIEMRDKYEYVPEDVLESKLNFSKTEFRIAISKLLDLKAINVDKVLGKRGYRLTFTGLDILSIKMLYVNKILKTLGLVIGEGKESKVYYGYDFDDNTIIVKFHRVGKTSYKAARKLRGYREKKSWISVTLDNAKREFQALECLSKNYATVPKPFGYSFNGVAMEYIEGIRLDKYKLINPKQVLDNILGTIRIAYINCGMVHGDLSPYNILIDANETPYVIDWPQWRGNNSELLNRDLTILLNFFKNKYNLTVNFETVVNFVKGKL